MLPIPPLDDRGRGKPDTRCCFACGKRFRGGSAYLVDTRDGQYVWIGPECRRKVCDAGEAGYLPPGTSTRLYPMP